MGNGNTGVNAENLLTLVNSTALVRLVLFASPKSADADYSNNNDGPETNLPLLAVLAEIAVPVVGTVTIVFDGLFLTAQRQPRYSEVKMVLDAAQNLETVFFASSHAPFTASLSAMEAANRLRLVNGLKQLTAVSRPEFMSMLVCISEADFAKH